MISFGLDLDCQIASKIYDQGRIWAELIEKDCVIFVVEKLCLGDVLDFTFEKNLIMIGLGLSFEIQDWI